jgi:ATP-dependent Clp protease ATP-binding subunit ClpC
MNYNFTDRVRKVLAMAREEAIRLQHDYVGTEHILLGLIREGEGVAAAVLANLAADLDELGRLIEENVRRGKSASTIGELPYTSRAKKVLEYAMAEARELNHSYVGTEHLLLGLLREEKGLAAKVLGELGIGLDEARTETLKLLGTDMPSGGPPTGETEAEPNIPGNKEGDKNEARPDHRSARGDRAGDGGAVTPEEEQPRPDRRAGGWKDRDRRGARPGDRAR